MKIAFLAQSMFERIEANMFAYCMYIRFELHCIFKYNRN